MCGICGFLLQHRFEEDRSSLLESMNDILVHRGPDSDGYYLNGDIGMGMRRLSIIDLVSGDQPIFNEDGSIAIVYNGEIYNFQELRDQLQDECLLKFNGMFVFSLWDDKRKRMLIARDRMGQKPLYST